jgi:uncharacterized protein (DUF1684 family)
MLPGRRLLRVGVPCLVVGSIVVGGPMAAQDSYRKDVEAWRTRHEADYRKEYVPLAGLFPLVPGANTAGSASGNAVELPRSAPPRIGQFVVEGKTDRFEPQPGVEGLMLNDQPVGSPVALETDGEKDGPDELHVGPLALWVHLSGDRLTIRLRDPGGEPARAFTGFRWFPIDDSYRVTGRFIRDAQPRELRIPNQLGDEDLMTTEGVVEFTLHGETVRLRPMTTRPNRFWFIFRDGTSGKETYETARFLYADLRADGTTVLDFNEAYNPPCAFNPYTTCPLPLPENRVQVRIVAGERKYEAK